MATEQSLPKKIAVLMGGPGSERDVSLATGQGVAKALCSLGVAVVEVDVRDGARIKSSRSRWWHPRRRRSSMR